ncbi:ScbR family autoregulator-binding transcription factor [Microbacterium azadirachtae]|uniref:ScbR family autoregulator-binding transcription factor n=1 Tax=Microbacterium azadirachtae TaxID=582680 RepID=UPI00088E2C32|nr:ScbR family autoregulator-binding transcription factor [Microbacterium azadirachtae]SDL61082.1 DNA-binding transcriptional regulator, AcrR family [Microbacterium azadirachtae]SEF89966.1 DNA-binding transcriptional regulator, AcrR family [Microbacterium azadirachtae]SEF91869.1 DNA-binding transcriptional regulator, AcrR family [Microbacterium azadirachtae]
MAAESNVRAEGRGRSVVQSRAIEKREQLLLGAAAVFDEVGYSAATLSLIEQRSGVSRGAMYFQFTTKREIADAVIDEQHRASSRLTEAAAATGAGPIEQLVMMSHGLARQILDDPLVRGGIRLTMELAFDDSPVHPYLGWITVMADLLRQGQSEGLIDAEVDADAAARVLVASYTGTQVVSHVLEARKDLPRRVDDLLRIFLTGIMTPRGRDERERILGARA